MKQILFFLVNLLMSGFVLADGPCPDGTFNPSSSACMCPNGGYVGAGQYCTQERYLAPRWGAFALNLAKGGGAGKAHSEKGQQDANEMALSECKTKPGADCRIVMTFKNTCGAFAWGKTDGIGRGTGNSKGEAERSALSLCLQSGDQTCKVQISGYCAGAKNW